MAALLMGLTGCSNEDFPGADSNVPAGKPVAVTLTVGRGAEATRTTLTPEGLGLKDEWEGNEDLVVFNKDNRKVGTISFQNYIDGDKKRASFSGTVTATDGEAEYYVWYLGKNSDDKTPYASTVEGTSDNKTMDFVKVELNNQSGKSEDLACGDLMYGTTKIIVKGNQGHNSQETKLKNALCMLRIDLGIQGGSDISDATLKVKNGNNGTYSLVRFYPYGEINSTTVPTGNTLTINNVNTAEDVYFALVPGDYNLNFELTKDDKSYSYILNKNTLEAGVYYTNGTASGSDGLPGGVSVTLIDDSLNPLNDWASANLVYDKSTQTSSIAENDYMRSSLYQWGRNRGWADYIEAQGYDDEATYDANKVAFELCTPTKSTPLSPLVDLTGYGTHTLWWYSLQNTMKKNAFLINSEYNGTEDAEDWWPISERRNDDWDQRAAVTGYTKLAPDTWRIPKKSDYEKILPTDLNSLSFSQLAEGYSAIKSIDENNDCAFKWQVVSRTENNTVAFRVQAIVVAKGTALSSVKWDNPNVKQIFFGSTGMIAGYIEHYKIWRIYNYNDGKYYYEPFNYDYYPGSDWEYRAHTYVAGPIPDGTAQLYYDPYEGRTYHELTEIWNCLGHYWTSDGYEFTFCFDPTNIMGEGSYCRLGETKSPKTEAYAVRCVRNK